MVCRSLGLRDGWTVPLYGNYFIEEGPDPVWLENPRCRGDEAWLGECPGVSWGTSSCNHTRDISVFCYDQVSLSFTVSRDLVKHHEKYYEI